MWPSNSATLPLVVCVTFLFVFVSLSSGQGATHRLNSEELKELFPDHPVILNPEYKKKSGLLLSQTWEITETHMDVQEPLYQHIAIPCFNCSATFVQNNCACDYSDPKNCGKVPKGCPEASCPQSLTDLYCSKDLPKWTEIDPKDDYETDSTTMKESDVKYFRFYFADPCEGFQIKFSYEYGTVETYVGTLSSITGQQAFNILQPSITNQTWNAGDNYPGHTQITICPSHSQYRPGTFVIATVCRQPEAKFSIKIYHTKAVTQRPESVGGGPIIGVSGVRRPIYCNNSTTVVCLNDTEPYTFLYSSGTEFPAFRWDVSGKKGECTPPFTVILENLVPGTFSFLVSTFNRHISLFESTDTSSQLIVFASIYTGENIIHSQYCFEETGTVPILFTAETFIPVTFRITVSTNVPYFKRLLTDLSPYQYGYEAVNVMDLVCPQTGKLYCDEWLYGCNGMWHVYPSSKETDPFWPTPASWGIRRNQASNSIFESLTRHELPLIEKSNDTFTMITLLRNNIFGKEATQLTEEEFSQCTISSWNSLFNAKGKVLLGKTTPRKVEPKCDSSINEVVSIGEKYVEEIQKTKSFGELLRLTFQVNTLFYTDAWLGCSNYTNDLLISERKDSRVRTTECLVTNKTSKAFLEDPCCNKALLNRQCCSAKPQTQETTYYTDVATSKIDRICNAPSCVENYMQDYLVLEQQSLSCSAFSSEEYPLLFTNSLQFYVDCKAKYNIDKLAFGNVKCTNDEACYFGGVKNKCNRLTNRCILSKEAEQRAWDCVYDGLSEYEEYYLKERFSLPGTKGDPEYKNALFDATSSSDCVNIHGNSQFVRNGYTNQPTIALCNCRSVQCLDTTCELNPQSCQISCFLEWVPQETPKSTCESQKKCNWGTGSLCSSTVGCNQTCTPPTASTGFCAYCDSDAFCTEIPGITSQSQCEAAQACMLPTGRLTMMPSDQCESVTGCTQLCPGQSCQSANGGDVCVALISRTACSNNGGVWRTDIVTTGICSYGLLDRNLCLAKGAQYLSCSGLTLDQCNLCNRRGACPVNQTLAKCYVSPKRDCISDKECRKSSGNCTDLDYYVSLTTVPPTFGACIYPTAVARYQDSPACTSSVPQSPEGCYRFQNQTVCAAGGGKFRQLAMTKSECIGDEGCASNLQLRSLFTMTPKECKECKRTRESFYTWTKGYPSKGKPVTLEWKSRAAEDLYDWKPTTDWVAFSTALTDSISATVLTDIRSGVVCSFNARASLLKSITCACLGSETKDDVSSCFSQETSIETGTGEACIALDTIIQTTTGSVEFDESSVSKNSKKRCADISVYSSSIYSLEQPEQFAFSPLSRVRDYDGFNVVLNSDNAIVGRAMSDGFEIKHSGATIQKYTLCIRQSTNSGQPPSRFDVWDFGYRKGDFLVAMGIKVSKEANDLYCGVISDPGSDVDYFLIVRMDDYQDESGSLYSSGETACWWFFGAAFTVLTVWGIAMVVAHYFGMSLHYYFRFAMIAFSFMSVTRALYFYLLAARVLEDKSDSAGTYFLIEFPTLMYITAFSCMAAFWLFLLYNHLKRVILLSFGIFNCLVYIVFIVLIILFEALPESKEESQCSSREPSAIDNSKTKIVSIVYQSIMAGISSLLALFILIAGGRLFFGLQRKDFEKKVAWVTLICTVGLLLHCSFILYLSATFTDDFTIIVLMIVLSELIPISFIMFQFSLLRAPCFGKIKIPKYNRARMLSTLKGGQTNQSTTGSNATGTSNSSDSAKGSTHSG